MLVILAIMVGAALVVAAVAHTATSLGVQEQKEEIVNYAVRFLFGDVPRQRTGAVFLSVAALGIFVSGCNRSQATTATPVPEVEVATVEQRDVPVYSEWVATLDGYVNAQIRPQVSGYIIKQNYTEGSLVRKSQVLFEINPRPFTAALDSAKGDLAQSQAQLGKSPLDVERDTPLAEARAIAKSQLDNEVQAKLGAQAAVESAKAAVEQAELNLEWTKVTSLVDGIAGIAQVQIGNLVGANSVLTSVSQVDPIKAFFPISEHEYVLAQKSNANSSSHTIRFFGNPVAPTRIATAGTNQSNPGILGANPSHKPSSLLSCTRKRELLRVQSAVQLFFLGLILFHSPPSVDGGGIMIQSETEIAQTLPSRPMRYAYSI